MTMKLMSSGFSPRDLSCFSRRFSSVKRVRGKFSVGLGRVVIASGEVPASKRTKPSLCSIRAAGTGTSTQVLVGFLLLRVAAPPRAPGRNQPLSPDNEPRSSRYILFAGMLSDEVLSLL